MGKPIHASDILLFVNLWGPEHPAIQLVDPEAKLKGILPSELLAAKTTTATTQAAAANVLVVLSGNESDQAANDYQLILNFAGKSNSSQTRNSHKELSFELLHDPMGGIRWLFPKGDRSADFLRFYNASNFRSKLIYLILLLSVKTGLYSLINSASLKASVSKESLAESAKLDTSFIAANIFTGTAGLNRKVVMSKTANSKSANNKKAIFYKVAIGENSTKLIASEKASLTKLAQFSFEYLAIPTIVDSPSSSIAAMTDIRPKHASRSQEFTGMHALALQELAVNTHKWTPVASATFVTRVEEQIRLDERGEDSRMALLVSLIKRQLSELRPEMELSTSFAHGDLTPWNCYLSFDKLAVYDWEHANGEMPLLYDLFHYIVQTEIIIGDTGTIDRKIQEALAQKEIAEMLRSFGINPMFYKRLYLVGIAAYWISKYRHQELRKEEIKQLQCWIHMLEENRPRLDKEHRPSFLEDLQKELGKSNAAVLKFRGDSLAKLSVYSDIDLLADGRSIESIENFCRHHRLVERVRVYKAPGMRNLDIDFKDGENLSLDLLHAFCRKNLVYLPAKEILRQASTSDDGLLRLQPAHEYAYIACFNLLNRAAVPAKYLEHFDELGLETQQQINDYLQAAVGLKIPDFRALGVYQDKLRLDLIERVRANPENGFGARVKNGLGYLKHALGQPFGRRGFIVTLSGADGAGKSTIVLELNHHIHKKWRRKTVMLRHRPGILPMMNGLIHGEAKAKQMAKDRLPRQGKNKSLFSSLVRFTYYFIDYFFGQVFIYLKYVLRGYVVIYDRYFFDFIVDPKRSNLAMGDALPMFMYRFLMKPRYNFFLDAPADVILARKQELKKEDIEGLHSRYRELFEKLSSNSSRTTYQVVQNLEVPNTVETILNECKKRA